MSDAICGGGHRSHEWSDEEIKEHSVCIDCYCGISFKREGDIEYKYYSCTNPIGTFCKKHGVTHRPCEEPGRTENKGEEE